MIPVNLAMSHLSNTLFFVAVVLYSLATLAFAIDLVAGRVSAEVTPADIAVPAMAGAGRLDADNVVAGEQVARGDDDRRAGIAQRAGMIGIGLTLAGYLAHFGSIASRGLAVHRPPWGNMYEFSSVVAFVCVTGFLLLLVRKRMRWLGVFVLIPVVAYMGIAGEELYVSAGPLVPALQSYWIWIHVAAAIIASGTFLFGAVAATLYLLRERYDRITDRGGRPGGLTAIADRLPTARTLDRTTFGIIAFGFPVWTMAIITGAIWAEHAWGRYWGWDPKETWSFITWVLYAGYLHARTTAGWKGRRAAVLSLVAFSALTVDYYVVNLVVSGLHSYGGLPH